LATFSTALEKEEKEGNDEDDENEDDNNDKHSRINSRKSKHGNHLTECLSNCAGTLHVTSLDMNFKA
jgi:hypothetical protein